MVYYIGDLYRASLAAASSPDCGTIRIIAHCEKGDNAFYYRDSASGQPIEKVCLEIRSASA